ncbi:MAG: hypothetical protein ACTSQP_17855 [Promethearchaeota archaeon]
MEDLEIKKDALNKYKKWAALRDILRIHTKMVSYFKAPEINYVLIKSNLDKMMKHLTDIKKILENIIDKDISISDSNEFNAKIIFDMNFLEDLSLNDLKYACRMSKIKGYSKLNKKELIEKLRNCENLNVSILLRKLKEKGIRLRKLLIELERYLNEVQSKLDEWKEKFKINFGKELRNLIKEMGLNLEGHYPLLKSSFFTFEIDFEKPLARIWYGPKQEKLIDIKLDSKEISRKFKELRKEIIDRDMDDEKFISKLFKAYEITCFREKKELGEQVPIIQVLLDYIFLIQDNRYKARPSKKFYFDYNRTMFSYDLYRLRIRKLNGRKLKLIPATRAYTKSQKDFLWVPIKEAVEGNYYSHLIFEEVKK